MRTRREREKQRERQRERQGERGREGGRERERVRQRGGERQRDRRADRQTDSHDEANTCFSQFCEWAPVSKSQLKYSKQMFKHRATSRSFKTHRQTDTLHRSAHSAHYNTNQQDVSIHGRPVQCRMSEVHKFVGLKLLNCE